MAFIAKQDISLINWTKYRAEDGKEILERMGIPAKAAWYLPQLMAFIGSQFHVKRREDGKFSFKESIAQLGVKCDSGEVRFQCGTKVNRETLASILKFLAHYPRSDILPRGITQASEQGSRWATGVPLVLSAFKEFRDIKYSSWAWDEDDNFIKFFAGEDFVKKPPTVVGREFNLREASLVDLIRQAWTSPWTAEELCQLTEAARPYKTGAKAGELRSLNQLTSITTTELDEEFDKLGPVSWLKPMLCQTWVFQPHIISKYAINNCKDLDVHVPSIRGDLDMVNKKQDTTLEDLWG